MTVTPLVRVVTPPAPPAVTPKLARLLMQIAAQRAARDAESPMAA